ncbi:hypothetical protein [Chitinophaga skermanii]|uniref:hypothetical protein n=1 Tax=Chitinophaga skermanii TaxID=331697 RepID=UPI0011E5C681|nr:hypothetical protein [Chitinophaga skermanii]
MLVITTSNYTLPFSQKSTVPLLTAFNRFLPVFAGFCRFLPVFAGFCRNMPENTGFCRFVPENAAFCHNAHNHLYGQLATKHY